MIIRPRCHFRECVHLRLVKQKDGTEVSEKAVCAAFPDGIPKDIAYGTNPHTTPYPGDHGIMYERKNDAQRT